MCHSPAVSKVKAPLESSSSSSSCPPPIISTIHKQIEIQNKNIPQGTYVSSQVSCKRHRQQAAHRGCPAPQYALHQSQWPYPHHGPAQENIISGDCIQGWRTVESLCAMMRTVRPTIARLIASATTCSLSASSALVASSRRRMRGESRRARAI